MNIKVAAFTVSEKSSNTRMHHISVSEFCDLFEALVAPVIRFLLKKKFQMDWVLAFVFVYFRSWS